ncbi:MAG: PorP/SprF family type IX secretion system membrane protein [Saprospiraceae bacterium]|nr:PorP/SprF family type IX secretion system membrane protein [Saprospiraceae bacterium]
MKKIFLFCLMFGLAGFVLAQEEAVFSHYTINPTLVNPATAGMDRDNHHIFLNLRSGWTGFPGSPKTYSLNYNGAVGNMLGLGAMLYSENIAALTRYRAQLSYAIHIESGDYKFGGGVSTEIHRTRVSDNSVTDNPTLYELGDDLLMEATDGFSEFDASLGFYTRYQDQLYFGVSFPNLVRSRLDNIEGLDSQFNFIAGLGGEFQIPNNKIKIQPSILIRQARNAPLFTDLNMLVSFLNEQLITGLTYRIGGGGNLGFNVGTKYNSIRFLYTYEIFLDEFQNYNGGTHEISINFLIERTQKDPGKR